MPLTLQSHFLGIYLKEILKLHRVYKNNYCCFVIIRKKLKINEKSKFGYCSTKLCHVKALGFYVAIKNVAIGGKVITWKALSLKENKHSKYCNYDLTFFYSQKEKVQPKMW